MLNTSLETTSPVTAKQALRQKAEAWVSGKVTLSEETFAAMTPAFKMLHELQVHQIELEIQNEELRRTQLLLETARERYFDLYDLAPVSYCTVSVQGIILEANLATTELLGETRSVLVGQPISRYITKDYQDVYYQCHKLLFATGDRQGYELHLARADGTKFWIYVTASSAKDSNGDRVQRMVLTDTSDAKVMGLTMHDNELCLRTLANSRP